MAILANDAGSRRRALLGAADASRAGARAAGRRPAARRADRAVRAVRDEHDRRAAARGAGLPARRARRLSARARHAAARDAVVCVRARRSATRAHAPHRSSKKPACTRRSATRSPTCNADIVHNVAGGGGVEPGAGRRHGRQPARAGGRARRSTRAGIAHHYLEYGSYFSEWRRRNALKMWTGWPTFPMVFVKGALVGGAERARAADRQRRAEAHCSANERAARARLARWRAAAASRRSPLRVAARAAAGRRRGAERAAAAECRVAGIRNGVLCGIVQRAARSGAARRARRSTIHYVVVPAMARRKLPDPVFLLAGGPGPERDRRRAAGDARCFSAAEQPARHRLRRPARHRPLGAARVRATPSTSRSPSSPTRSASSRC